jgi:hypothetical protein
VAVIRTNTLFAPGLLAALLAAFGSCGPAEEAGPADPNEENPSNTDDTTSQDPDDSNTNPDDPATQPNLDTSSVVDFPAGITVASPVSRGGRPPQRLGLGAPPQGGSPSLRLTQMQPPPPPGAPLPPPNGQQPPPAGESYAASAASITDVLSGAAPMAERFEVSAFFTRGGNANCYGPSMSFANHPDALGGDSPSGQLPGGDLGIWTASTQDGEACAAAQLNTRMRDVRAQVSMGLTGLAGLVAAYQSEGATWPDDVDPGASIDLTSAMNEAGVEGVSFNAASMSRGESGGTWSYELDMAFTNADGAVKAIVVTLQHSVTDRDAGLYEGLLNYVVEDEYTDRNCRDRPNGEVTINGSVHYIKSTSDKVVLQARSATACGLASALPDAHLIDDAITSAVLTGNAVDPAGSWADNFNVFTAEFDPSSLLGNYSYAWQAGSGDSHTRVLDVGLETEAGGEAYFGFGDAVQASLSGEIKGFICNWAGPGNSHDGPDFAKYAQRQFLTKDEATGKYVAIDAASSDITYAPTRSCMYDGAGSFVYDRDVDGALDDETADTAGVMHEGTTLAFDLMTVADGEAGIWEHIQNRGYSLPSYP